MSRANETDQVDRGDRFQDPPETVRDGVASWTTVDREPQRISGEQLAALRDAMEGRSLREALGSAFGDDSDGGQAARNGLFTDAADAWRIPVADAIGGRCLDVNAGVGTRSLLLAELADSVDAADTALDALAFLGRRDDYASADRVVPIHAELTSLPTPSSPYDTVVADLAGPNRPDSLSETVEHLTANLADHGAVVLLLDGWPRLAGVTDAVGLGTASTGSGRPAEAVRTCARGYERRLLSFGFESVDLYGLVPDPTDPSFVVPVGDRAAARRVVETGRIGGSPGERLLARSAGAANASGFLDRSWPAYLAVCHADADADGTDRHGIVTDPNTDPLAGVADSGLVRRGGGRSTVLRDADGRLSRVTKVPHRRAHAEFVLDECRTMRTLRSDDETEHAGGDDDIDATRVDDDIDATRVDDDIDATRVDGGETETDRIGGNETATDQVDDVQGTAAIPSVAETIPSGSVTMTRFGPTYSESPMDGTPLADYVSRDPDRFRRVLELGFDWLTRLHRQYGDQPAQWSHEVVRDDLTFREFDLVPPRIDGPVRLFRAPCHGDFHPKNVFVDDDAGGPTDGNERTGSAAVGQAPDRSSTGVSGIGPVTAVIDWELGGLSDNPIADPAFFALQTARLAFGSLEAGVDAAFASPGPHADAVRDTIAAYCDAVDITRDAFLTYLPYVWIRRLRRCAARGATASYSGRAVRRANDVQLLWDRRDAIRDTLGSDAER